MVCETCRLDRLCVYVCVSDMSVCCYYQQPHTRYIIISYHNSGVINDALALSRRVAHRCVIEYLNHSPRSTEETFRRQITIEFLL